MQKLIIKDKDFTLELFPEKGNKIKLKKLKWEKLEHNSNFYVAKLFSIVNVSFPFFIPFTDHFFKQEALIRKTSDKLYYISTTKYSEECFENQNPFFSLNEAKIVIGNYCQDWYFLNLNQTFFIE